MNHARVSNAGSMARKVLVVGGTGFLGGHAARAFRAAGDAVTATVRDLARAARDERLRDVQLVEADVVKAVERVRGSTFDVVVYAAGAWQPGTQPTQAEIEERCRVVYEQGLMRVAAAAAEWNAHLFFISGITRFGHTDATTYREDTPAGPLCAYGRGKRRAEEILAQTPGLRSTSLVPLEVYGTHDRGSYLSFLCDRIRARRFVLIGDGANEWSIAHVDNVVGPMLALADGPGAGPLLVADAAPSSQRHMAEVVARALGRSPRFPRVPRSLALALAAINARIPRPPGFPPPFAPHHVALRTRTRLFVTDKARALGGVPRRTFEDGMREAIDWYRSA